MVLLLEQGHAHIVEGGIEMETNEIVREVIKKEGIDEGMAQILELLMSYNVNDEEWLNNIITNLCYNSIRKEEEE